jgi:hypothetical protein
LTDDDVGGLECRSSQTVARHPGSKCAALVDRGEDGPAAFAFAFARDEHQRIASGQRLIEPALVLGVDNAMKVEKRGASSLRPHGVVSRVAEGWPYTLEEIIRNDSRDSRSKAAWCCYAVRPW